MRKFILRSLAFLIPAILVLAAVEAYVRQLPNTYRYKDEWMWKNGHRVNTIVLGNSHAYYGIIPSVLGDSVFNLSNVSQRLEHDYFLLTRYASACQHLSRVVMVVDNSCLFDPPMEDDEPARVAYYQIYMGYHKHSPLSQYGFEMASMTYFWQKLIWQWRGDGIFCDSLGWGNDYVLANRNPDDFLDKNIREHRFRDWNTTCCNRHYLDAIAEWCRKHHIRLTCIQTPVSMAYTRKASAWQLRFVNEVVDSICLRYGAQAYDYSQDARFADADFFDSDHLNDQGAKKFSEILRMDMARHQ